MANPLPYRKVHLDFHTHPSLQGIGADFNASAFAEQLAAAHVDGIVLFAKDHYGYSFHHSENFPVHPHLAVNFLPLAARACRERGIHVEAYISVCLDNVTWQKHPEWSCRDHDGKEIRWGEPNVLLDLTSPLLDEVVVPYTREVAREMDVDGLWFDIVMYPDDGYHGDYFNQRLKREGCEDTAHERGRLARRVVLEAQQKIAQAAREERSELHIVFNNQMMPGDISAWPLNDVLEIESDPSVWPLHDMLLRCRFARSVGEYDEGTATRPHSGLTTRFARCWGDFGGLRSSRQVQWELGRIFASGATRVSMGDHLHPRGVLEPAVYQLIGEAFTHCRQLAPLVERSKPLTEVALIAEPNPAPYSVNRQKSAASQLGAVKFLLGHAAQLSVRLAGATPAPGELIFLPGGEALPDDAVQAIKAQVNAGHALIAFGEHARGFESLVDSSPAQKTPLAGQHLLFENALADHRIGHMAIGLDDTVLTFEPGIDSEVIAHCRPPLFDKSLVNNYHAYGPVSHEAEPLPVIVSKGRILLCGVNLPELLHRDNAWTVRLALSRLLAKLVPVPLVQWKMEEGSLPEGLEISLHREDCRLYIHLVVPPAAGLPRVCFRVNRSDERLPVGTPLSVSRISGGTPEWRVGDGFLEIETTMTSPHDILVVDYESAAR